LNLQTLANLAEIFGVVLVITGVFFGLMEVRHYRQQRQETATMEIMRAFQSHGFTRALRLVMDYEQECRHCGEEPMPQELQDAAMLVSTTLEAVGLMVFQRIVPFRLVQQLMGGTIQASWRVLRPHTEWMREKLCRSSIHEWFRTGMKKGLIRNTDIGNRKLTRERLTAVNLESQEYLNIC
jgi:hypothetical protein